LQHEFLNGGSMTFAILIPFSSNASNIGILIPFASLLGPKFHAKLESLSCAPKLTH